MNGVSPRQKEIIYHVASGLSNAEIGKLLVISEHTVKTHVRRAMRQLAAKSRAELVTKAFAAGLLTVQQMKKGTTK